MSVVKSFEEVGPCQKRLTIEIPAEAVSAEMNRVIGDYRRQLRIPGFRRGKVPAGLVKKRFKGDIEHEVANRLVPRYWHQAQAEKGFDPLSPPKFDEPQIADGEPLTLVASVETRPEIELKDDREYTLPEGRVEPLDEEVESNLDEFRRQHATWTTVERQASQGDLVAANAVAEDGEDPAERKIHVELGGEGVDEELNLALTGLSAGQSADYEGALRPIEEARKYRLEVLEVKEQELPELDDAFAAKVGNFESADALRAAMAENLEQRNQSELRHQRQEALLSQLRERHPLELPAGLVQQTCEEMVQRDAEQLARQGVDLQQAEIDWASMVEKYRPRAQNQVHDRLLLDAVADDMDLRLDEREFEQLLAGLAAQQGISALELRQRLGEHDRLEPLRAQLRRDQTLRHLLGEDKSEDEGDDGAQDESAADASEETDSDD